MKILVMGDTHGYLENAAQVIEKNSDIEMVIHLGDFFRDATALAEKFTEKPLEYVYGNCDISVGNTPSEKILEVMGKRIFITHGHRYSVTLGYDKLIKKAREVEADMVAFGHTHSAEIFKKKGIIFLNPGSLGSLSDTLECSYAVVELGGRKINSKLFYIK